MARDQILTALEQAGGKYVSGEQLSEDLGVSRTAVWKQIKILRGLGYRITASPRFGYLLLGTPDLLYPRELRKGLGTRNFGKEIYHFHRVGSTNQVALDLARKGYPEGTVVIAEEQTAARGRWRRAWFSPPEAGICLSLILRPALVPMQIPQVTLVTGVSCARAIHKRLGLRPGIKWPNDLLLDGAKFGGILVEMEATAEQVYYLVVGIGINVNHEKADFPPELQGSATSLRLVTGTRLRRLPLVQELLELIEKDYDEFCRDGFIGLRERWLEYEVTLGKTVCVRLGETELIGEAYDLNLDGSLLLRMEKGETRRVNAGEITFCKPL